MAIYIIYSFRKGANLMKDFYKENPSAKKIKEDLEGLKSLAGLIQLFDKDNKIGSELNKITEIEKSNEEIVETIVTFRDVFHKRGWILSTSTKFSVVKEVINTYKIKNLEEAEEILLNYYTDKESVKNIYSILKMKSLKYIREWLHIIEKGFEYHNKEEYIASVPLFLMVIDGIMSNFTKKDNFFSSKIDLSVEDSLLQQITEIKDIFYKPRKKTNTDPIYIPYRNGILHGRDINYNNKYVSSKLINLLIAVTDWMNEKDTEDKRIREIEKAKEFEEKSILNHISDGKKLLDRNKKTKKIINEWKPEKITFTKDKPNIENNIFPENGSVEEYNKHPFLKILVEMLTFWKLENYGYLAKCIAKKSIFKKNIKDKENSPGELRYTFGHYKLNGFRLLKIKNQSLSLKRVCVELDLDLSETIKHFVEYDKIEVEFLVVLEKDSNNKSLEEYLKGSNWYVNSNFFDKMIYMD